MFGKFVTAVKNPSRAYKYLREKYTRRKVGAITFHPDNLPETNNPEKFSQTLHDDWEALSEELSGINAGRTLELGCNYGRWIPWVSDYTNEYYAIEPTPEAIRTAKSQYPHVNFEQTVASDLPFEDGYFDLVFSWAVLMHIPPDEIVESIEEIKRVTAPEGVIVVGEEVGTENTDIVFRRTLEEWEELFQPRQLVSSTDRTDSDLVGDRKVMRFE